MVLLYILHFCGVKKRTIVPLRFVKARNVRFRANTVKIKVMCPTVNDENIYLI
jgi:hypothetical protein